MATVVRREMKPHREKLSELRDVLEQEVAKAKVVGRHKQYIVYHNETHCQLAS